MASIQGTFQVPIKLSHVILTFLRRFLFKVLAVGPMPRHIAIIPDGNRRYEKKHNLKNGQCYQVGISNLMTILHYCHEMDVKYVSVYGFSIENFKRKPAEVRLVMDVIKANLESIVCDPSAANEFGLRIEFLGNLGLLDESVREAAKRVMAATAENTKLVLLVCLAYTSMDDIVHGICGASGEPGVRDGLVAAADVGKHVDKHMYFSGYPDPDILIRTAGETRLSNFLLWQSGASLLYAVSCLWPAFSLRHLVSAALEYQRNFAYLEKIKKKLPALNLLE